MRSFIGGNIQSLTRQTKNIIEWIIKYIVDLLQISWDWQISFLIALSNSGNFNLFCYKRVWSFKVDCLFTGQYWSILYWGLHYIYNFPLSFLRRHIFFILASNVCHGWGERTTYMKDGFSWLGKRARTS